MPSGLPLKREVSFLLVQADAAARGGSTLALGGNPTHFDCMEPINDELEDRFSVTADLSVTPNRLSRFREAGRHGALAAPG